ncbi:hypothetical protein [Thalassobius sp. MITS945101]|uniref:hypothetical protein n=1 Tax=Thalassobius sp. MITS945101 TaxID=3096994 RepID=UPI00399B3CEE
MKRILCAAMIAAFVAPLAAPAFAGPIERACLSSPRKEKSWPLCSCIGRVANQTLSRSDQRKAAKFFKDPQKAQDTRQSDNAANERFWQRYVDFGATAAAVCG